ncbi:hypothetical protein GCM10008107_05200 [Psychrosphaera saromensis]|uniref:ParE-like toxin domain-containing protein n=1 Tax=Psychrosphaera saromensis TaxID=716813 RepID=A0A2S7UXT3_9GAMM|nr:hypothetical protein BTO11_13425 [Psychrosphaera saromensis]GHB59036.1 hypothetical protein GCM10008107_05200 [Psychrosphaera saromensis]GLQ14241.1 hypothetical protein GCM10007917_16960 [Psychrosphaera saromensis]
MITLHTLFQQYTSSTLQKYFHRALSIQEELDNGCKYQKLGGRKLHLAKNLIRFKLGYYRLIFKKTNTGFVLETIILRKNLNHFLKRR